MKEPSWLLRAKETHKFHIEKKRQYPKWTLQMTAKELGRAIGPISEDMLIASWYRTHKTQIDRFDYAKEALEWIRERENQLLLDGLD